MTGIKGRLDKALVKTLQQGDFLVLFLLGAVTLLSWLYLLSGAGMGMSVKTMSSLTFPAAEMMPVQQAMGWNAGYSAMVFLMWWLMMIAMMLPSATPLILIYHRVRRIGETEATNPDALGQSWLFVSGYLLAWGGFSLVATILQALFERLSLLHPMMMWSLNETFTAVLLILAGVYQWTPLKQKCLKHCRSPVDFLVRNWRGGPRGALWMGTHHGVYCLGCCWCLMGLLFAGGVMNLFWVVGLAVFVFLEKLLPAGLGFGRIAGSAMMASGLWLLF
jgi:predicted metal-binding membrane protein